MPPRRSGPTSPSGKDGSSRCVIVKLGGSVLTGKTPRPGGDPFRAEVTRRLAREIRRAARAARVRPVLIHGGGLYGHPEAQRHGLAAFPVKMGLRDEMALRRAGVPLVQARMRELAARVSEAFAAEGLATPPLSAARLVSASGGRARGLRIRPVLEALEQDQMPLLYGDAVLDPDAGGGIVSGDRLAEQLASRLRPRRVVFVSDVEGVHETGVGAQHGALVPMMTPREALRRAAVGGAAAGPDVTGGMAGKLTCAARIASRGTPVLLVSGLVGGRLAKAIRGQRVQGTVIHA